LGERLGWTVYDRDIVDFIAEKAQVRASAVRSLGETRYSDVQGWLSLLIDRGALGSDQYVRHLVEVLTTIARQEPAIVLGRGASLILPVSRGIRVRVVAPVSQRIAYAVEHYEGMTETKARKLIAESDAARHAFVRTYFGATSNDALNHDLVLNTTHVSVEAGVAACLAVLEDRVGKLPARKQGTAFRGKALS
jgi:cytidylate kinase